MSRSLPRLSLLAALWLAGCAGDFGVPAGRTVIRYWDKWSGWEAEAMRAVVDDFNRSQDRIWVEFSSTITDCP